MYVWNPPPKKTVSLDWFNWWSVTKITSLQCSVRKLKEMLLTILRTVTYDDDRDEEDGDDDDERDVAACRFGFGWVSTIQRLAVHNCTPKKPKPSGWDHFIIQSTWTNLPTCLKFAFKFVSVYYNRFVFSLKFQFSVTLSPPLPPSPPRCVPRPAFHASPPPSHQLSPSNQTFSDTTGALFAKIPWNRHN